MNNNNQYQEGFSLEKMNLDRGDTGIGGEQYDLFFKSKVMLLLNTYEHYYLETWFRIAVIKSCHVKK